MGGLAVAMDLTGLIGSSIDYNLNEADHNGWSVGIVLSGGLDSSTVACIAENVQPGLPTFTGWYDVPGFDEREYAAIAAASLSGPHSEIEITPQDFVDHFDGMKAHVKPPIMGMGTFGQYMVARYIAQETSVTMVLSGEGSDELFGGYARQSIVAGEKPPEGYENYQLPEGYPTTIEEALQYDYDRLPELLAVDDQMTGAWGLQARAPFTDRRIVIYGLSLPPSERVGKRHLRERVRGIVPDAIIDRKDKKGFPAPLVHWANTNSMVGEFILDRIGYLPDPAQPWDRTWWVDLVSR